MRKAELQQDLVGHGHQKGPGEGRQQAQRPHGHVAAVFWKSNHSRAEHTVHAPSSCTAGVFSNTVSCSQTLKCKFAKLGTMSGTECVRCR